MFQCTDETDLLGYVPAVMTHELLVKLPCHFFLHLLQYHSKFPETTLFILTCSNNKIHFKLGFQVYQHLTPKNST